MGLSMFSSQSTPIAIDFGSSSVKLLQMSSSDPTKIAAAAELQIPDEARRDSAQRLEFFAKKMPKILSKGGFKGKRVICSIPSPQTVINHIQIAACEDSERDELVNTQLAIQTGCLPQSMVVRTVSVADVSKDGQNKSEVICFAIPRGIVMSYVELLKKFKLQVVGVHTEIMAMLRSLENPGRREEDNDDITLLVDLGWGCTKVAICHGPQLVFAKCIRVGGRHFDQCLVKSLNLDEVAAREHRLSQDVFAEMEEAHAPVAAAMPTTTVHEPEELPALLRACTSQVDDEAKSTESHQPITQSQTSNTAEPSLGSASTDNNDSSISDGAISELIDELSDELSGCLRYHQSVFMNQTIKRMVFVGGEARQVGLCQKLAKALRLPAHLGDPLANFSADGSLKTPGLKLEQPQPGWAVACGLCNSPVDL